MQAIRLEIGAPVTAELVIHDAGGRLVRTLLAGAPLAPGPYVVRFDGMDGGGRPLAAGVYFLTLAAEGTRHTERFVLLH
jgi:hypothetical protein